MQDIGSIFREYARLDLKRMDQGLSVPELERWVLYKEMLERRLGPRARPGDERRSAKRIPTRILCSYASSEELRSAWITELATGGVFVATTSPLPVGTRLELRLQIEDPKQEIDVEGVVVSTNVGADLASRKPGMGIRFSTVSSDTLEKVAELYAAEASRDLSENG